MQFGRGVVIGAARAVALAHFLVVVGTGLVAGQTSAPLAFVAEIPDLPLMPGLAEVPDAAVVFDKPAGRIVEAYAEGAVTRDAVAAFYARTLPQLGWRMLDHGRYSREGERLSLVLLGADGDLIVRFTIEPE